jgi:hypothetical protein
MDEDQTSPTRKAAFSQAKPLLTGSQWRMLKQQKRPAAFSSTGSPLMRLSREPVRK